MADLEYIELQGNEVILKAVEYLRMLPEWKAKPAKLRSGFVEYGELIARHLVNLYGNLEGKTTVEKIELNDVTNPLAQEKEAAAAMRSQGSAFKDHVSQLNDWHMQLANLMSVVEHVLQEIEGPDWMTATAGMCQERFLHLVETCPFPKADQIAA